MAVFSMDRRIVAPNVKPWGFAIEGVSSLQYAIEFNGNGQITIPNDPVFSITDTITLEARLNMDAHTSHQSIISKKDPRAWWWIVLNSSHGSANKMLFRVEDSGGYNDVWGSTTIPDKGWVHVAAVYDGSKLKLYLDGILDAESTHSFTIKTTTSNIDIGNDMVGKIAEARIWNVARTQAQINNNKNSVLLGSETGLVGYWKLEEGSGTTAGDSTSNSNDGSISNATWVGLT